MFVKSQLFFEILQINFSVKRKCCEGGRRVTGTGLTASLRSIRLADGLRNKGTRPEIFWGVLAREREILLGTPVQ